MARGVGSGETNGTLTRVPEEVLRQPQHPVDDERDAQHGDGQPPQMARAAAQETVAEVNEPEGWSLHTVLHLQISGELRQGL